MLTREEQIKYPRLLIIPHIGEEGRKKLKQSRILVAGLEGSGRLSMVYLASLGIGRLKIIDHGSIQLSDLNRQILYDGKDLGIKKAKVAPEKLCFGG